MKRQTVMYHYHAETVNVHGNQNKIQVVSAEIVIPFVISLTI